MSKTEDRQVTAKVTPFDKNDPRIRKKSTEEPRISNNIDVLKAFIIHHKLIFHQGRFAVSMVHITANGRKQN